jgi:putative oxidoreductase
VTIQQKEDIGKLILRITSAGLLFLHGSHSAIYGIQHVKNMVTAVGLPEFIAYGNLIGEVVAPIFIMIGYKARLAALVMALNMLASILIAHRDIAFARNDFGGWMIELNIFFLFSAVVISLLGAGRWSLSRGKGKWD